MDKDGIFTEQLIRRDLAIGQLLSVRDNILYSNFDIVGLG